MRIRHFLLLLLGAAVGVPQAAAQTADPSAGPASGLTGTGPRVDVQVGPNGTLDVRGARGADVDLSGANFRGSFGASRPQPGLPNPVPAPASPPTFGRGLAPPSFAPNLPTPGQTWDHQHSSAADRQTDVADLILPRFRRGASGGSWPALAAERSGAPGDSWRYQYFRQRWWYWQPSESWVYWDGQKWEPFAPRR